MEFLVLLLVYFGGALLTTYVMARLDWGQHSEDQKMAGILWPLTLVAMAVYLLVIWPMRRATILGEAHRNRVKRDVQRTIEKLEKELKL